MKTIRYISAVCIAAVLLMACQQGAKSKSDSSSDSNGTNTTHAGNNQTTYPFTITCYDSEALPIEQTFKEAPLRVVTNNLSAIETLFELGLGDKIVGITKPDSQINGKWKESIMKLNIIGDKMTTSKEIILGQMPHIIVGSARGLTDEYQGSIKSYNELGVNIFTQSASIVQQNPKLSAIIDDVRMLGRIFNVNDRAEEYAKELEEKHKSVMEQVSIKGESKVLTLLPMMILDSSKGTYSSFRMSNGLPLDVLRILNLKPAIDGSSHNNSYENLISINPDIILYVKVDRNKDLDAKAIESLKKEPLLKNVSAIKTGKVFATTYDDFMDYGPRNFDALITLYHDVYDKE